MTEHLVPSAESHAESTAEPIATSTTEPTPASATALATAPATEAATEAAPGSSEASIAAGPSPAAPAFADLVALAAELGEALVRRQWLAVTAESCTGGLIAAAMTEVAGSSRWFERGYVTYSNAAKASAIGVPDALIANHGAVSEPVAAAMAQGALQASEGRIVVAVTGIAGPGGAVPGKPVGTVCFGWAVRSDAKDAVGQPAVSVVRVETVYFDGDRAAVRSQTARHALRGLLALADADTRIDTR